MTHPPGISGRQPAKKCGQHHPKTVVPVPVIWIIPVAHPAADVVFIIVERTAPQHPVVLSLL
jgi:hypothetical protein